MLIKYLGHSAFLVKGQSFSVVFDPFTGIGYEMEKVSCDYCICSHGHFDHNYAAGVNGAIVAQGDNYNWLKQVASFHDDKCGMLRGENTISVVEIDGLKVCHLGDLGEPFNKELVLGIGKVDILLIPVGGYYTIDGNVAAEYAKAIGAKVVIPMHYKTAHSNLNISGCELFLSHFNAYKKFGAQVEITAETLPTEQIVYQLVMEE